MNSIQLIKEMVFSLERNKSEMIRDWLMKQNKTQMGRLYKAILKGGIKSDADAAAILGYNSEKEASYRKFKASFKDRLEELFLFVDIKISKEKPREAQLIANLNKQYAAWQNMALAGANNALAARGEELYAEAKRYSLIKNARMIITSLLSVPIIRSDNEKFNYYNNELIWLERIVELEALGSSIFIKMQRLFQNTKASKLSFFQEFEKDYTDFIAKTEGFNSPLINLFRYLLKICLYSINNSHAVVFETAKEGYEYFDKQEVLFTDLIKALNLYLIEGYAKQKNFELMEHHALINLDIVEEGRNPWFKTLEIYAFCSLNLGQYEKAALLIEQTYNHELYENQNALLRDTFTFLEAHLYLLYALGAFQPQKPSIKEHYSKPFRFSRFVNNLEIAGADKQGLLVVQTLLEISFQLIRGDNDDLIDRLDAIEKFFQRNTELEGHERVLAFYRLLRLGIKHNWQPSLIQQDAQPYYDILENIDSSLANQRFDMEFIPYLDYFALLLQKMK